MPEISEILDHHLDFDPAADFEAFLRLAPAKWAVYLLADEHDHPLQLLCVKNLRWSLKRRLQGDEPLLLSKRVNYRQIVRRIHWRRVDSAFEADLIYHEIARQIFAESYQGMLGFRPAWFIHVNPETRFPRFVKTTDLLGKSGLHIGPLEDKHAAARLIELVEDCFDLCRYYNILIEAPNARACAYKEMGKCPAPCDGSISMDQYHRMIEWSLEALSDPREIIRDQTARMNQASAELRFETAAKIKAFIDELSQFKKGPFRHAAPLNEFAYITLQPGPLAGSAKLFLILPGLIEELLDLLSEPARPSELLGVIFAAADRHTAAPLEEPAIERIGIVAHHLFSPKQTQGVFLKLSDVSETSLIKAYKDLRRQKQPAEAEGEGVLKELQAM
jgi:UvrB/uvrC motif